MSAPPGIELSQGAAALAELTIRGGDAARFLQGQLSAEIEGLAVGASTLAGFHNPQGRVIALLGVTRADPEQFFAVLPGELAETVAQRLRKYVLRAKVSIEVVTGAGARRTIELDEVRQGVPQVYVATSGQFVAQMLNLDLLGAIAFDKGCYTGQEVIARAHYRGRVKRRMQRWLNAGGANLQPGDNALGPDGRSLVVVRVAAAESGQELLAIGTFRDGEPGPVTPSDGARGVTVAGPLPLPYALPD